MSSEDLDNPSVLTVCVVCTDTAAGEDGIGVGGELLAQLETLHADHAWCDRVRLVKHRCLMACTEGCVVSTSTEDGVNKRTISLEVSGSGMAG